MSTPLLSRRAVALLAACFSPASNSPDHVLAPPPRYPLSWVGKWKAKHTVISLDGQASQVAWVFEALHGIPGDFNAGAVMSYDVNFVQIGEASTTPAPLSDELQLLEREPAAGPSGNAQSHTKRQTQRQGIGAFAGQASQVLQAHDEVARSLNHRRDSFISEVADLRRQVFLCLRR